MSDSLGTTFSVVSLAASAPLWLSGVSDSGGVGSSNPAGDSAGDGFRGLPPTKLLLVEDERALHRAFFRVAQRPLNLRQEDFLTAMDVAGGMQVFDENPLAVAAVLSDMRMPGGNGIDIYHHVRKARPSIPFAFWSGGMSSEEEAALQAILDSDQRTTFFEKPADLRAVVAWFRSALLIAG